MVKVPTAALAKSLNCTLVGVSDVLREMNPDVDLPSGKLVEDSVVQDSLNAFFLPTNQ